MRFLAFGYILQFIGLVIIASSMMIDVMIPGTLGYGKMQFAITIVGIVVILMGLGETVVQKSMILTRMLLIVYVEGILFMGLGTEIFKVDPSQPILSLKAFSIKDLLINIFGFLPFGYLVVSNILTSADKNWKHSNFKISVLTLVAGISLSFLIETSQHFFISGRFSSIFDIIGNSIGTIAGICLYYLARKWDMLVIRQSSSTIGFF
jgi:hypothetical protein